MPPIDGARTQPSQLPYAGVPTPPQPMVSSAAGPSLQGPCAHPRSQPTSLGDNTSMTDSFPTFNSSEWWTMRHVTPPPPPSATLTPYDMQNSDTGDTGAAETAHSTMFSGVNESSPRAQDWVNHAPGTVSGGEDKARDATPVAAAKPAPRKSVRSNRRKKNLQSGPVDPAKPLTAYNLFFKFERDRLLKYCADNPTACEAEIMELDDLPAEYNEHYEWTLENSVDFQTKFMQDHWSCDKAKRPHRKSHGRIAFTSLTKFIAASWNKRLPESTKNVFRLLAERDTRRWRRDMARRCEALQHSYSSSSVY
jgi:hypothetical protein